jgi:uncharacterized protein
MGCCGWADGEPAGTPRFFVDAMLGRLSTWLRILGYDAEYRRAEDDVLLRLARDEGRIFLTRDIDLARRRSAGDRNPADQPPLHLLVHSDHVMEQLRQVVRSLGLDPGAHPARRCPRCNAPLKPRAKTETSGRVPEFVWSHYDDFWGCQTCGRIYWAGSHRRRIDETIRALMA